LDTRVTEVARLLVDYSTKIKEGDKVLIQITDCGMDLAVEVYKLAAAKGASPLITATPTEAERGYYSVVSGKQLSPVPEHVLALIKASDVFVSIRGESNPKALSSIDSAKISTRQLALTALQEERLSKRWTLTQYPTDGYAQEAEMSLHDYEDFVYRAILRDWEEERHRMRSLSNFLNNAQSVRILGEDTDLTMSIKDRYAVVGDVTHNVPGGEVFTAPLDNSAEGTIYFNFPAPRYGKEVSGVRLKFSKGELVDCSAEKNEDLLKGMVATDPGAKRLGELGIGTNYGIDRFTKNILFDEKIGGTIHLALGRAYPECGGVNKSAIHWDFVKALTPGELVVDGEVILKDGKLNF
jgi:aminopeptidase